MAPRATLALLLLLPVLAACSEPMSDEGPARDVDIVPGAADAGSQAFSPADTVISLAGQTKVTWFNADFGGSYGGAPGTPHLLKSDDGTTFESGTIPPGGVFEVTFTTPGTYSYHCEYHSDMQGTITVNP
jgi:plastocyanin